MKRFVKNLPVTLRNLLTPDIVEPDANVFDAFFAVPNDNLVKVRKPGPPEPPLPPPPLPRIGPIMVDTLPNGFRIRANSKYENWPVNLTIRIAYADGSRNPSWSEYDFEPSDLEVTHDGCEFSFVKNKIQAV